jgi:hypothetical protein
MKAEAEVELKDGGDINVTPPTSPYPKGREIRVSLKEGEGIKILLK